MNVKARPENFDADFWTGVLKIVARVAVVGVALIGASGGAELVAQNDLQTIEFKDAKQNWQLQCGESMQELLLDEEREQAACDAALEAFARHRGDEEEWANVLRKCHSGEGA